MDRAGQTAAKQPHATARIQGAVTELHLCCKHVMRVAWPAADCLLWLQNSSNNLLPLIAQLCFALHFLCMLAVTVAPAVHAIGLTICILQATPEQVKIVTSG